MGKEKAGPEMIECPSCSKMMIINNPRRPLVLKCSKCKCRVSIDDSGEGLKATLIEKAPESPSAPEMVHVGPLKIKCPRCTRPIEIISTERPLKIICPHCGAKMTIRGEPFAKKDKEMYECPCGNMIEITSSERPYDLECSVCGATGRLTDGTYDGRPLKQPKIKCKCGTFVEVTSPERPWKFECPTCGMKGRLMGQPEKESTAKKFKVPQAIIDPPRSRKDGSLLIKCPSCKKPMELTTTLPPVHVTCPHCGSSGTIGSKRVEQTSSNMVHCIKCGAKMVFMDRIPRSFTCPKCGKINNSTLI